MILKILIFFALCYYSINIYSQDRIIFTSGKERKCSIVREDSAFVYVILKSNGKDQKSAINRNYIQSVIYSNSKNLPSKITYFNGEIVNGTINHEDSASMCVDVVDNGIIKTIYVKKNSIKTIEAQNLDNISTFENNKTNNRINNFCFYFGPSYPLEVNGRSSYLGWGGNLSLNLTIGLNRYINLGVKAFTIINGTRNDVNSTLWKSGGFLGGLGIVLPTKYIDFHFRSLGGLMFLESPESSTSTSISNIEFNQYFSNTIGYNIGLGLDFKSNKNSYFLINVEFMHGYFKFHDAYAKQTINYSSSFNPPSPPDVFGLPAAQYIDNTSKTEVIESKDLIFNILNFNIGVGFSF